jgi:serine protease AprX
VDNASNLDNAVVVVAAGNEHQRALALKPVRRWPSWLDWLLGKPELPYDTELGCPGQARQAITVGAMTKNTFNPAYFSSYGPTAYGIAKPDISAPGVNITSTIPLPRDAGGQVVPGTPHNKRFGRKSGTSMATPIVAGAVALMIQKAQLAGTTWSPASIKSALKTGGVIPVNYPQNVVGAGRLNLKNL